MDISSNPSLPTSALPTVNLVGASCTPSQVQTTTSQSPDDLGVGGVESRPAGDDTIPLENSQEGLWFRFKMCFGYAGLSPTELQARRLLINKAFFVAVAACQLIVTVVLTALGIVEKSPVPAYDGQNEFSACPELAAMNLVMLARTAFASYLLLWAQSMRRRVRQREALDAPVTTRPAGDAGDSSLTVQGENPPQRAGIRTANFILHVRLAKLVPLLTILCYFVLELIDIFRGTHCRTVAPHIYALTSVIVIVMSCYYCLQFGKMFTLSIWEFRAARRANQPAVRKLSQSTVDRIPLVIYVPTDNRDDTTLQWPADSPASAPPRKSAPMAQRKRRFVFFRQVPRTSTRHEAGDLETGVCPPPDARPPYPFVRLPAHQARCTICLCEFEGPPQAVDPAVPSGAARNRCERPPAVTSDTSRANDDAEVPVGPQNVGDGSGGRASEGESSTSPQPLRLLGCGHAYHKGCIDPWLTGQSGRCPYCQATVEVPV